MLNQLFHRNETQPILMKVTLSNIFGKKEHMTFFQSGTNLVGHATVRKQQSSHVGSRDRFIEEQQPTEIKWENRGPYEPFLAMKLSTALIRYVGVRYL